MWCFPLAHSNAGILSGALLGHPYPVKVLKTLMASSPAMFRIIATCFFLGTASASNPVEDMYISNCCQNLLKFSATLPSKSSFPGLVKSWAAIPSHHCHHVVKERLWGLVKYEERVTSIRRITSMLLTERVIHKLLSTSKHADWHERVHINEQNIRSDMAECIRIIIMLMAHILNSLVQQNETFQICCCVQMLLCKSPK